MTVGTYSIAKAGAAAEERGQITLVLQGGGALGAYQGGVYQALHERGMEPDWVIGTSIGAVNAGLIAGNAPEKRLTALQDFWKGIEQHSAPAPLSNALSWAFAANPFASPDTLSAVFAGIPGFFEPNLPSLLGGPQSPAGIENASYYSTAPLRKTLLGLIDFELLNKQAPRITVGAANVHLGTMKYFDSRDVTLGVDHILASGALPPAFPAIKTSGDYYWDGGVVSNTPLEAVFDDRNRKSGVVFSVEVWQRTGPFPQSIFDVLKREKDIQYASRLETQTLRQKQIHKLRHIIMQLSAHLPEERRENAMVKELVSYGCATRMHVVQLQAPALENETYLKDIDFSAKGIHARWQAGYQNTAAILGRAPWREPCDPLDGVILHNFPLVQGADA